MVLAQALKDAGPAPRQKCWLGCPECARVYDRYFAWVEFVSWLQTDGPGRTAHRDPIALRRAYIQQHNQDGIMAT